MKPAVNSRTVDAAELRALQAAEAFNGSWARVLLSSRVLLAKPSTLLLVSATTALFGFWLARRPAAISGYPGSQRPVHEASRFKMVLALATRYGVGWLIRNWVSTK